MVNDGDGVVVILSWCESVCVMVVGVFVVCV